MLTNGKIFDFDKHQSHEIVCSIWLMIDWRNLTFAMNGRNHINVKTQHLRLSRNFPCWLKTNLFRLTASRWKNDRIIFASASCDGTSDHINSITSLDLYLRCPVLKFHHTRCSHFYYRHLRRHSLILLETFADSSRKYRWTVVECCYIKQEKFHPLLHIFQQVACLLFKHLKPTSVWRDYLLSLTWRQIREKLIFRKSSNIMQRICS